MKVGNKIAKAMTFGCWKNKQKDTHSIMDGEEASNRAVDAFDDVQHGDEKGSSDKDNNDLTPSPMHKKTRVGEETSERTVEDDQPATAVDVTNVETETHQPAPAAAATTNDQLSNSLTTATTSATLTDVLAASIEQPASTDQLSDSVQTTVHDNLTPGTQELNIVVPEEVKTKTNNGLDAAALRAPSPASELKRRISVRPTLPRDRSNFSISSEGNTQLPRIGDTHTVGSTAWVVLQTVEYTDEKNIERKWDVATRTTKKLGVPDAVIIVPLLKHSSRPTSSEVETILVTQYRVPIQHKALEFPAGLVDEGESPEVAALRELKEETGYIGHEASAYSSREMCMTPGMCDETVKLVVVHVDLDDERNQNPQQDVDESAYIDVKRVPLNVGMRMMLENKPRRMPISLLYFFALGVEMGNAFATGREIDLNSIGDETHALNFASTESKTDITMPMGGLHKDSTATASRTDSLDNNRESSKRRSVRPTLARDKSSFSMGSSTSELTSQTLAPIITEQRLVAGTRWLALNNVDYTDELGVERSWDVATRTTKQLGVPDAVIIIPLLRHSGSPSSATETILAKQFRVPIRRKCVEFPAGLVDKGESPEDAALREFNEETGYHGERATAFSSRELCMTPGMCDETVLAVIVHVDLDDERNHNPKQHCDEGEYVSVTRVPLSTGLRSLLEKSKTMPIAYLYFLALGIEFGASLGAHLALSIRGCEPFGEMSNIGNSGKIVVDGGDNEQQGI